MADAIQKCKADKDCKSPICYTKNAEVAGILNQEKSHEITHSTDLDDALCAVNNGVLGYFELLLNSKNKNLRSQAWWKNDADMLLIYKSAILNNQFNIHKELRELSAYESNATRYYFRKYAPCDKEAIIHEAAYYGSSELLKKALLMGLTLTKVKSVI